jgi:hypothetical protein
MVTPAICTTTLLKFDAVKKFGAQKLKRTTMIESAKTTGRLPRLPPLRFYQTRVPKLSSGGAVSNAGAASVMS